MLHRKGERSGTGRNIAYIAIICISVVLIYFLAVREMRFFLVPSRSMVPALVPSEYLLTLNQETYSRGDIVVLKDPEEAGEYLVKRIVGIEGDTLMIRGGGLFIDSSYVSEPYCPEPIDYEMASVTVQPGNVFVLGDNRNWSIDSHDWNQSTDLSPNPSGVPADSVVGKVRFVYLPLKRMRKITAYPLSSIDDLNGN